MRKETGAFDSSEFSKVGKRLLKGLRASTVSARASSARLSAGANRHNDQQAIGRALELFELTSPGHVMPRRQRHPGREGLLRVQHEAADIPPRTFISMAIRRRVSSREICAGPSTSSIVASSPVFVDREAASVTPVDRSTPQQVP